MISIHLKMGAAQQIKADSNSISSWQNRNKLCNLKKCDKHWRYIITAKM